MNKDYYEKTYMPQMNKIGVITNILGVIASFLPAIVLAVIYGIVPKGTALLAAFVAGASSFGVLWFVEPISYFPTLGPVGTYMAFLSGNISNMRVPCASMAQVSVGVEPGTEKGSVIATIGMAVSIIMNTSILTVGVIAGSAILAALPATVVGALNYLLPALFGALIMQFGLSKKGHTVAMLGVAVIIYILLGKGVFTWLPGANNYLPILGTVFISIAVGISMYKKAAK